jgi:hypothetical protein
MPGNGRVNTVDERGQHDNSMRLPQPFPLHWRAMARARTVSTLVSNPASWKVVALISVGIVAVTAVLLHAEGRIPFCKCGIVSLWAGDIWSNQNSQQFTDPYTFTHIIHGVLMYGLLWLIAGKRLSVGARLVCAVALESGWELLENSDFIIHRYRETTISLDYYGDSIFNSIGDITAMALGFGLAWRLPARVTAISALVLDTALLFLIHDSLLVNIVMLIYPIEAIRLWQLR